MPRSTQQDILSVGIPKLLSGVASFLIRIVTVRFLEPAGYGVLALGLNCLLLFDALFGAALDVGATGLITGHKACDSAEVQPAEKAAIWLKFVTGGLLLVCFGLAGEWLGRLVLHGPGGRRFFLVLSAGGTCILFLRSLQLYFQARLRFRMFGAIDVAHTALRVLLVGAVLLSGAATPVAVLGCFALAPALIVAAFCFRGKLLSSWNAIRPQWSEWRRLLRTGGPILASFSSGSIVSRLDVFLLALYSTPAQLGLYGAALVVATVPEILGAYVSLAFLPRILPACKAGTFLGLFRRMHAAVFAVAAVIFAVTILLGQPVLSLVLPAKYSASIGLVKILIAGTLAAASFMPLTLNFLMLTRPRIFLLVDIATAPLLIAAYYLFVPAHGALAAAWITCLHRLVKAGIVQGRAYALAHGKVECVAAPPRTVSL